MRRVPTVAVDFDGVLHTYDKGWHDGTIYGDWIPGAREALRELMGRYAVAVFTTRNTSQVGASLTERGFPVATGNERFWNIPGTLLVTNMKVAAFAYVDDRAVRFTDWGSVLKELDASRVRNKERP